MSRMFKSFFLGGFECSSHRRIDGRRLDLLAATAHDRLAKVDYSLLGENGITAVRDGVRWHLLEPSPGRFDWSSLLSMVHAAQSTTTQVIWDLCHYGWPDHVDIWSGNFPERFARFAAATAISIRDNSDNPHFYCAVNEISFLSWAGGEAAEMYPGARGRGSEMKSQLVKAAIAATEAVRDVDHGAQFVTAEPLIHVASNSPDELHISKAENYRLSQYEATDMLTGKLSPELGGRAEYVNAIGLNFYPHNQWYLDGPTIPMGHHAYRPLQEMLEEVERRYDQPIFIAETGAEGSARPSWLHYVSSEVRAAMRGGVSIAGICLYPVLDCPGWENNRTCRVGLLSSCNEGRSRAICRETQAELLRQQVQMESNPAHARECPR
jgi:beta-glucosidase/6-phospho-beta-glucosidase/beta-galactosidase